MNGPLAIAWPISESAVERLGWVLVHSLWQFTLAALLAGVLVRALRRNSAATRYGVLVVTLAVSAAAPVATWLLQPGAASGPPASPGTVTPKPELNAATTPLAAGRSIPVGGSETPGTDRVPPGAALETPSSASLHASAVVEPDPSWLERVQAGLRPWLAWLVVAWGLGVVVCSLRPLLGWHMLRRLQREGVSPAPDEVLAALRRVSGRLGLRHAVGVLQSTLAQVPVLVGYVRPVILLPVSLVTRIPPAQLEAILAHELAHVRRHDFVVNLLQTLVETIFFYHPAVWWLSRQVRVEREYCCDDLVVQLLDNRVEYGRALVAVEQMRGRNMALALGAADGSLLARVRRILDVGHDRNSIPRLGRGLAAFLGLACLGVALAMSMNWNLTAKDEPGPKIPPAGNDRDKPTEEDVLSRKVSLTAKAVSLKDALAEVAGAAKVELQLDVAALKQVGLDVNQPVTVTIKDEPLVEALGRLIDWEKHYGALREVRGGRLVITTLEARQAEIARHLPEWLKPHYNRGLLATLDDDQNVVSITGGAVMSDELLGKVRTLPKLRELEIGTTKLVTPAGLKSLAELPNLQKLSVYTVKHDAKGLGDTIIQNIVKLKSLRELHLNQCGTTDAGIRLLEAMPWLTHLSVYQEARLTDAALASIARLKRLKYLGLDSYVGTVDGWMRFSKEATRSLAGLTELEYLHLVGQEISPETLQFPRLRTLSLGHASVDDACATRIAACRQLQVVNLVYTNITDEGMNKLADLPDLRRLNLDSTVVTDAGIKPFTRLPKLEHVSLRATRLTDEALRHLAEIKTLTRVDLHGSGEPGVNLGRCFTVAGVQRLRALPKLRTLGLTNVDSAGSFLGLKELTQLRELTLMMTNIREQELDALEAALPHTRISSATGAWSRVRKPK